MRFGYLLFLPDNAIFILTRQNKYAGQYRPVSAVTLVEAFYHGKKSLSSISQKVWQTLLSDFMQNELFLKLKNRIKQTNTLPADSQNVGFRQIGRMQKLSSEIYIQYM